MAWDFNDIAAYFRQYAGIEGLSGAAFFGEWTAADGFDLSSYPVAFAAPTPPTQALPQAQEDIVFVDVGAGWVQASTLPGFVAVGRGTRGALSSGVQTTIVIKGWGAKSIGFGYVLGIDTTLAQIQTDQTQGILLVRGDIATDGTITQIITMNDPFSAQDLTEIGAWMNAHGVTNAQFATKMGWASPAEGQAFMLANSRRAFLQRVHDLWDS